MIGHRYFTNRYNPSPIKKTNLSIFFPIEKINLQITKTNTISIINPISSVDIVPSPL